MTVVKHPKYGIKEADTVDKLLKLDDKVEEAINGACTTEEYVYSDNDQFDHDKDGEAVYDRELMNIEDYIERAVMHMHKANKKETRNFYKLVRQNVLDRLVPKDRILFEIISYPQNL